VRTELTTWTASHVPTSVHCETSLLAIEVDTRAKLFSNILLWCPARFHRAPVELLPIQGRELYGTACSESLIESEVGKKISEKSPLRNYETRERPLGARNRREITVERFWSSRRPVGRSPLLRDLRKITRGVPRGKVPLFPTRQEVRREEMQTPAEIYHRELEIGSAGAPWIFTRVRGCHFMQFIRRFSVRSPRDGGAIADSYSSINLE